MKTTMRTAPVPPIRHHAPALRAYPVDSPQARARLIVLALFADGLLDDRELNTLNRGGVLHGLGIRREEFVQVLHDFCSDVASLDDGAGRYRLSAALVAEAFAEVTDRTDRGRLLRHILAVIASDGEVAEGERALVRNAVDAWQLGVDTQTAGPVRARSMRRGRATPFGT